jgi:nucleotide-binding universal stress UspA family protein
MPTRMGPMRTSRTSRHPGSWAILTKRLPSPARLAAGVRVLPVVRRGPPWDKLLNVATDYGAEVVVVGSSGQRGVTRGFPLGSVASRVLALSSRSVFVTRSGR